MADCGSGHSEIVLKLPEWLCAIAQREGHPLKSAESRMRFAIELARQAIERRTGGPFGAAVFERDSGQIVGVGVNLVEASNCSMAHAEMIAMAMAQQALHV